MQRSQHLQASGLADPISLKRKFLNKSVLRQTDWFSPCIFAAGVILLTVLWYSIEQAS